MPREGYQSAAICRRGHTQAAALEYRAEGDVGERCAKCGAKVITVCESCGHRIRGDYYLPGVIGGPSYKPPQFCDKCGAAHPWVGRQGRIYELQNRLENEDLDPADELTVREQLEALLSDDLDEAEQQQRWARIKRVAPKFWESSQPLITTVVSAAIQGRV